MEALGKKDFAVDFPFVGSDDLLDFSLDVELDESNKENINFSKSSSSVVNGGSSSLPVTAEGEEDLEWLYAFPPVPVEFDILDDKPDIGVLRQHSPDSVLENVVSSGEAYARSGVDNRIYQGIFRQLPSGFPYFVRKKRIGRKRRTGFGQDKHLLLVGHEVSVVNVRNYDRQEEPATPVPTIGGRNGVSTGGRRSCLHCGTDTTPQWRVGPMGPKTLCNACGVRYNSGRLVPEYRPACSPTFSARLHSNSHRKIIEMRKQKQVGMVKDSF